MYVSVFDCNCTLFVFTKPALTEHYIKAEAENLSYVDSGQNHYLNHCAISLNENQTDRITAKSQFHLDFHCPCAPSN